MKTREYKIYGCLLLIGAIVVSVGFALPYANAGFGKTITTAQMANMFGGGFVWGCDTDCDTAGTGCPGGDTCEPDDHNISCRKCDTTNGDICGTPNGWPGWQCVNGTDDCNGKKGMCIKLGEEDSACSTTTYAPDPIPDCPERDDC